MCTHTPCCPEANTLVCCGAHVLVDHSEQGWCKLCNGIILFDDGWYITPDGSVAPVPRAVAKGSLVAA